VLKTLNSGKRPVTDAIFLGFRISQNGKDYFPKWDLSRLMLTVLFDSEKYSPEKYIMKIYSILIMLYPHDIWEEYRTFYTKVLQYFACPDNAGSGNSVVKSFLKLGVPTDREVRAFYLGMEDGGPNIVEMQRIMNTISIYPPVFEQVEGGMQKCTLRTAGVLNELYVYTAESQVLALDASMNELMDSLLTLWTPPTVIEKRVEVVKRLVPNYTGDYKELSDKIFRYWFEAKMLDEVLPQRGTNQCDIDEECEPAKPLNTVVKIPKTANKARSSKELKTGSFNPYGNGQGVTRKQFIERQVKKGVKPDVAARMWNDKKKSGKKQTTNANSKGMSMAKKVVVRPPSRAGNAKLERALQPTATRAGNIPVGWNDITDHVTNHLSPCAAKYLAYLVDPFTVIDGPKQGGKWFSKEYGEDAKYPCIPTFPTSQSLKYCAITRFNATASATTGGFVVCLAPQRLANDYANTFNTNCPIAVSSTAWTGGGDTFPQLDSWTATPPDLGINMQNVNTQYSSASLAFAGSSLDRLDVTKFRLVACGLRVRYIGANMVRAGVIHSYVAPDHSSLSSLTTQQLSNIPSYFAENLGEEWHTLTYSPVDEHELKYLADGIVNLSSRSLANVLDLQSNDLMNHHMGMMVYGGALSAPYACEVIQFWEVIGRSVSGKTRSESDVAGLSTVLNVATPATAPILNHNPQIVEKIAYHVPQSSSDLGKIAESTGGGVGEAMKTMQNLLKSGMEVASTVAPLINLL